MKRVLSIVILGFIFVSCTSHTRTTLQPSTITPFDLSPTITTSSLPSPTPTATVTPWIHGTPISTIPSSISLLPISKSNADRIQLLFKYQITWENYSDYGLAAASPDGKWLALASGGGPVHIVPIPWISDHSITPWINPTTSRIYSYATLSLSFSPDSMHLAIESTGDRIAVFDLQQPDKLIFLSKVDWPTSVVFTGDGKKLIVGTQRGIGGYLQLWDIETASFEKVISRDPSSGGVCSVAISPDGKILAAGHCSYVFDISTWNIDKGYIPLARLVGLDKIPYCNHFCIENRNIVLFNPSTGDIASGTNMFRIPIQNPQSGKLLTIISTPRRAGIGNSYSVPEPVNGLAYTPDGSILAIATGNELQLRDAKDSNLLWYTENPLADGSMMSAVTITPDSRLITSIDSDGNVEFWGIPEFVQKSR